MFRVNSEGYVFHIVTYYIPRSTVCMEIFAPVLFYLLSPSLSASKFETRGIPLFKLFFFLTQPYLVEFKTGQNF